MVSNIVVASVLLQSLMHSGIWLLDDKAGTHGHDNGDQSRLWARISLVYAIECGDEYIPVSLLWDSNQGSNFVFNWGGNHTQWGGNLTTQTVD